MYVYHPSLKWWSQKNDWTGWFLCHHTTLHSLCTTSKLLEFMIDSYLFNYFLEIIIPMRGGMCLDYFTKGNNKHILFYSLTVYYVRPGNKLVFYVQLYLCVCIVYFVFSMLRFLLSLNADLFFLWNCLTRGHYQIVHSM